MIKIYYFFINEFLGQLYEEQDQYVQDRSKAMEQVESTIVELGDMFVQLAGMVKGIFLVYSKFEL